MSRASDRNTLSHRVRIQESVMRRVPVMLLVATVTAMLATSSPAAAQGFSDRLKRTVERAAQSEVERRADQETRRITRCALGDERCIREAEQRGDRVEISGGGAAAGTADPGGDHPLIVPYQGSNQRERRFEAYNEYQRIVGFAQRQNRTERLEGRLTRLRYDNPPGRSTFEIEKNYRDALAARGFRVDYECQRREVCGSVANPGWNTINGMNVGIAGDLRYFTGSLRYGDGTAYVSIAVNPQITYVHVLETADMDTGMVAVDASALAAGLERDGKVTLDGIYFDTGRATLKAESSAALEQAALLMQQQPSLALVVVGHTDSVGNATANMRLSRDRAEAVRAALVARGVNASRLSAEGVGSHAPVAGNDTEAGRALNRRVELVKQ
jgi:OmpA-OmpF porin, OOP family